MPEYLAPGVYVEELQTGPRPIEGVGTSTAGMVGVTERGPLMPMLVTSWLEFQRLYGGYIEGVYLPYAVQGFFDNGGKRLYIARVVGNGADFGRSEGVGGGLTIQALGRGAMANRMGYRIIRGGKYDAETPTTQNLFRLDIIYFRPDNTPSDMGNIIDWNNSDPDLMKDPNRRVPDVIESFDNLTHVKGAPNNVETVVNAGSNLVRVWQTTTNPITDVAVWSQLSSIETLAGNAVVAGDYLGKTEDVPIYEDPGGDKRIDRMFGAGTGLIGLSLIDEIALLGVPDEAGFDDGNPVLDQLINQCENLKDRFAVISARRSPPGGATTLRPPRDTSYAGFYAPWIEVYDPRTRGPLLVPPTGHIMGLIARTDIERGVFKAPANEVVRDATSLEYPITKGTQDLLNPRGVNCIRDFRADGRGIRLWGARTSSSDPLWKYVNVRRLFIFIEESIDQGTQWVVFEPNDEPLWAQVRRSISGFLVGLWKSGALMGLTEEEAFFVKCDRTTMTQDDIDNGRLICYIGVAPVKPAEFVIFRISQKTAEAPA